MMPVISRTRAVGLSLGIAILLFAGQSSFFAQNTSVPGNFQELSERANIAREQGRSEEAISEYTAALKITPTWPEGWWYLGTLEADRKQYANAIAAFSALVKIKPNFGPGWASLGLCEFEIEDYSNSLFHLKQAQELGFADLPSVEKAATYHLALLLIQSGDFENGWELIALKFGKGALAAQTRTALALALLRVPILPDQLDPSKDALVDIAGETAALLVHGNVDQAIESFQQMLRSYPNTPYLHYAYGSALMFRERYPEAAAQLREETRISPKSALPYVRLAIVSLKTEQEANALADATRAVQLAPKSATAHAVLARVLTDLGKTDEAAREAATAAQLKPDQVEKEMEIARLYSRGPGPIQKKEVSSATQPSSTDAFDVAVRAAEAARNHGRNDQAISNYVSALKQRPEWAPGWYELGNLYYLQQDCAGAVPNLKNAIGIDPKLPQPWVGLALCEFNERDYQSSYLHLERGRELGYQGNAQEMTVAVTRLAELRNLNGDFYGAADLLIPEARRGRLTAEMKTVLGLALLRTPLLRSQIPHAKEALIREAGETASLLYASKYDDALHGFQSMLTHFPNTPFLHLAYASALETLSRYDEAESQLKQELSITPRSPLSQMRFASIALKLHRYEQALEAAGHAVEIDPGSAGAHELMGRALLELGRVEMAVKALETASKLAPNYPEVHFNLARAYTRARETAKAERERALFAELNDAVDRERASQAQAYGMPQMPSAPADRPVPSPPAPTPADQSPR